MIPYIALILTIAGVIIGASVLTTSKFGDSIADKCYNSSFVFFDKDNDNLTAHCANVTVGGTDGTTVGYRNLSAEYLAVLKSLEGQSTLAEQQPTIAIISTMVIIISIIAGVFVYMRYFA